MWHNIGMADYKLLLAHENQKLEVLRDTRARVDQQIAESEQFIKVLTSRSAQGDDELNQLVERQMAAKTVPTTKFVVATQSSVFTADAPLEENPKAQLFPRIRADSAWPYILVLMHQTGEQRWRAGEIVKFVLDAKVLKTASAVRTALASMHEWQILDNAPPGFFSLTAKANTFIAGLKPGQYQPEDRA